MIGPMKVHPRRKNRDQAHGKTGAIGRSGGTVVIECVVPYPDRVAIERYDLIGRRITSLVNQRPGAGSYRYLWDTRGFAQGR